MEQTHSFRKNCLKLIQKKSEETCGQNCPEVEPYGKTTTGVEASLVAEGCRDALVVWNGILVDGHNRYKICTEHSLVFRTVQRDFENRDAAKLWIMNNQLSRRNLNDFQHVEIVHKCENAVKAQAKKRQATSTGGANPQLRVKLPEAETGKRAG